MNSPEDTTCKDFAKVVPKHMPSICLECSHLTFLSFKFLLIFQDIPWTCSSFLGTPRGFLHMPLLELWFLYNIIACYRLVSPTGWWV